MSPLLIYILALVLGCVALYGGGEFLIRGASIVGRQLGLSPAIIGLLLVSLGTSAPELFVSASAALQGYSAMAVGNVIGSNIVNLCLVLGIGASMFAMPVDRDIRNTQMPLMVLISVLGVVLLADNELLRWEAALLLIVMVVGLWYVTRLSKKGAAALAADVEIEEFPGKSWVGPVYLLGGVILLMVGAEALIHGGVGLAELLGVPDAVIALTVTSIGTGLPEITATIVAVRQREHALAFGNVVGSNIMNIGLVLGVSAGLTPILNHGIDMVSMGIMLALSFGLWLVSWKPGQIPRLMGLSLLGLYAAYVVGLAGNA